MTYPVTYRADVVTIAIDRLNNHCDRQASPADMSTYFTVAKIVGMAPVQNIPKVSTITNLINEHVLGWR
jgi:hypothetical protein